MGADLDFIAIECLNGEVMLFKFESKGLNELDITKYDMLGTFPYTFYGSDIKRLITDIRYHRAESHTFPRIESLEVVEIKGHPIVIGKSNVGDNQLKTVITEPGAITKVESRAMHNTCMLSDIDLSNVESIDTEAFINSGIKFDGEYRRLRRIGWSAFKECNHIGRLKLEGIQSIVDKAFEKSSIQSIELGTELVRLSESAFKGCSELESIIIKSNKLTRLEDSTFISCVKLKKLILPDGIIEIGSRVFEASGIEYLVIPKSCTKINPDALIGMLDTTTIHVPKGFDRDVFRTSEFSGRIVEY